MYKCWIGSWEFNCPTCSKWCWNLKLFSLRIIGHSYRGVWHCIAGFWDLQTTSFEIPWFLGLFYLRVLNFECFSVWMSIRRIRMCAPIRHGADLTIQNHTIFRNNSSSLRLNKNSGSFCANGILQSLAKTGRPFCRRRKWLCSRPAACSGVNGRFKKSRTSMRFCFIRLRKPVDTMDHSKQGDWKNMMNSDPSVLALD